MKGDRHAEGEWGCGGLVRVEEDVIVSDVKVTDSDGVKGS